jgi:adenylate cyclase|tara:strand:+ start:3184 stop:5109 length:1926 start_codon:yes stop_codon:yes gene_type:complete
MKFFTSRWMVLAFAILLLFVRVQDSDYVKTLRYKTWDYFQIQSPRANLSDMVAIVDITEQDLKEYGQWPWPRHIMAMLHARISDAGAVMINYNILFAEPDRMGSKQYLNSFPMSDDTRELLQKNLVDTDRVFAIVIKESGNTILMMSVKNERDNILPSTTNIIQKGDATPWIWNYAGIVPPLATLSAGAEGIGVNVTAPEPDSVVRKVPILIRIESKLYPSMVLENIRIINQSRAIKIITKAHGIDEVLVAKNSGIPVNHNAEMYIHYANPDNYIHLSAGDILKGKIDKKDIAGKIIIVGLDAAGLSTLKDTPYGLMTDQTISAQTLDTVLTGDYLFRLPQADTYEILFMGLLGLLMIILIPRASVLLSVPLLIFVLSGISYGSFMAYANKGFLIDPSFAILYIFLIWSHSTYNNFATQSRLRQQIKRQFEHYLAPDMVKKLQKDPSLLKLGGETRTMTFLFSDIRGFTPISEKYKGNPEGLTKLINRFLTRMTDVIIKNGGTIDKFMGDCIMAFWNAPIENGEHEECAVQSAMEMEEELAMLNAELIAEGLPQINIGIGINTGEALVGNMGSKQRFDYSVIGDAVNLASRLESSSKTLGKTIVIGQETVDRAKLNYNFEYIDDIKVKGKTEFIKVYTITN